MFSDPGVVKTILSMADNIYCIEDGKRQMLVYHEDNLFMTNERGGMVYWPVSEIKHIAFNYDLHAWRVEFDEQNPS